MDARVFDEVIEVTVEVDTAVHAANDVIFQAVELENIARPQACAVIQSIVLVDYDDQGIATDLLFFSEPVTVGDNNAAFLASDADMSKCLGRINIPASDYLNLTNNQIATTTNCGLVIKPDPAAQVEVDDNSVWMIGRTAGTPTYAGGRLTLRIGVLRG